MNHSLNEFEFLDQLASTGTTTTYKVKANNRTNPSVLKLLRPYLENEDSMLASLSTQMPTIAQVTHENVLPVFEKSEYQGKHWIHREYIDWPSLEQEIDEPRDISSIVKILYKVSAGLQAYHEKGVIHGNIKLSNIFIEPNGDGLYIADAGLSILHQNSSSRKTIRSKNSYVYAAPEISQNKPASTESDVYSLAMVAYVLLTGQLPFNAVDPATILVRQLSASPALPSSIDSNLPENLDQILIKGLSPQQESRYRDPKQFVDDLATVAQFNLNMKTRVPRQVDNSEFDPGINSEIPVVDILCSVCGQTNLSNAEWCVDCWSVLQRSSASTDSGVITTTERDIRKKRRDKIILMLKLSLPMLFLGYLGLQYYDERRELPSPVSDVTAVSEAGEWSMENRNLSGLNTQYVSEAYLTDKYSGEVRWALETSKPMVAGPAVKDGVVYVATQDSRVLALDENSGDMLWEHETVGELEGSPVVAGELVYYTGENGRVTALNINDGSTIWVYQSQGPIMGSPIVHKGEIYFGSGDHNIYGLDAMTGKERWRFATEEWITNTPVIWEDLILVSSIDGRVNVLDMDTGNRRYTFRGIGRTVFGSPTITDGIAYVPFDNGYIYAINVPEKEILFNSRYYRLKLQLFWWDMAEHPGLPAGVIWGTRLKGHLSKSISSDADRLYVTSDEGNVYSIDRNNGKIIWKYPTNDTLLSAPVVVNNTVFVGGLSGKIHKIDGEIMESITLEEETSISSIPMSFRDCMTGAGFNISDSILTSEGTIDLAEMRKLNPNISMRSTTAQTSLKGCLGVLENAKFEEASQVLDIANSRINKIVIAGKTLYASSRDGNLYAIE